LSHKLEDALQGTTGGDSERQTFEIEDLKRQLANEKKYRSKEEENRKLSDQRVDELEKEIEELKKKLLISEKNFRKTEEEFDQIRVLSENYTREIKEFMEKSKRNRSRNQN